MLTAWGFDTCVLHLWEDAGAVGLKQVELSIAHRVCRCPNPNASLSLVFGPRLFPSKDSGPTAVWQLDTQRQQQVQPHQSDFVGGLAALHSL